MASDQKMDRLLNIETTGMFELSSSTHYYNRYEATPYQSLELLFKTYEFPNRGRFVDVGSGKGRLPIYVSHYFPNDVRGIERNPVLHERALENRKRYYDHFSIQRKTIDFVREYAERYEVEKEDTFFYFFNPFALEIFKKVMQNIIRSVEKFKRSVEIILFYPIDSYREWIENDTSFQLVEEIEVSYTDPDEKFFIYRL